MKTSGLGSVMRGLTTAFERRSDQPRSPPAPDDARLAARAEGAGAARDKRSVPPRNAKLPLAPTAHAHAHEKPPLKALEGEELAGVMASLKSSMRGWEARSKMSVKTLFTSNPQKAAWNTRVDDTPVALSFVKTRATNVAYMFQGQAVGLLSVSRPNDVHGQPLPYLEVHALVSHPGTQGVGGALVEHAVNLAQEAGANGTVRLTTLRGAKQAYQALGFRQLGMGVMELEPSSSDQWTRRDDGTWCIARHADKKYIEGFDGGVTSRRP